MRCCVCGSCGAFALVLTCRSTVGDSISDLQLQRNRLYPHIESLPDGFVKQTFIAALQTIEAEITRRQSGTVARSASTSAAPSSTVDSSAAAAAAAAAAGCSDSMHESPEEDDVGVAGGAWGASVAACVSAAGVRLTSRFFALSLAVHVSLLDHGFVCNGSATEDPAMAGFAPPARGVCVLYMCSRVCRRVRVCAYAHSCERV